MSIKAFKQLFTQIYETQQLQGNIKEFTDQLDSPLLTFNIVDADVTSGANDIPHGLGRQIVGFFIVDINADVRLWKVLSEQTTPNVSAVLQASGTASVKIYFY